MRGNENEDLSPLRDRVDNEKVKKNVLGLESKDLSQKSIKTLDKGSFSGLSKLRYQCCQVE